MNDRVQRSSDLVRAAALLLLCICLRCAAQTPAAMRAPVRRVVSLAPSVTETLFALGAGDLVVGVSTYCNFPAQAQALPRVGSFLTPNVEEIIALEPDLVIGVPSPGNEEPVKTLEGLGLAVVVVDPQTVAGTRASITIIARAVDRAGAGRRLLERFDARLAAVQQRVRDAPWRRVLVVVGEKPLVAVGSDTFQDELIHLAHGINVAGRTTLAWPHPSLESVIAWAPQVIIDAAMGSEAQAHALAFWQQFPSLPAVRDRHVYAYRADVLLRPGPRLPQALAAIAYYVHPERFAAPPAGLQ